MNDTAISKSAAETQSVRGLPSHSTVGTNDLDAAAAFYDKLLSVFGIGRVLVQPGRAVYFGRKTLADRLKTPSGIPHVRLPW
ncbi:hypothetical protein SAMN05216228_10252 [Rhizobium tibeticum]|uniref:Glyoxalase-like domain protein n=1 Tax=Rhizobium tibeticum TaxID=501024 RepID=A0ABY1ASK1_9HYPH|nr:hypothetical protein SAMN05216228_10252 [Rhizobium tibeticum]